MREPVAIAQQRDAQRATSASRRPHHAATHGGFLDGGPHPGAHHRFADTAARHGLPDDDPAHPRSLPGAAA